MQIPNLQVPDSPPRPIVITQDKFDRGVITLIDQTKLPRNALKELENGLLGEDGAPMVRPGLAWYATAASADSIDGGDFFVDSSDDIHLLKVAGGTVYRSLDDGLNWSACTGATLTADKKVSMIQAREFMYIFNGWDNIVRYDGTTVLDTYTSLPAPTGSSATKTGLSGTTYTYRYRVSAVNDVGFTDASAAVTESVGLTRDSWDATNKVTFTWTQVTGAVR